MRNLGSKGKIHGAAAAVAGHDASAGAHGGISSPFAALTSALDRGASSASFYVVSDSTAITSPTLTANWPAKFLADLADKSPAYNLRLSDYDGDSTYWRAERIIYTAPGGVRGLRLYGAGANVCPWRAATGAIATDFAVQIRIKFEALPASYKWLVGRYSTPDTDWVFRIGTDLKIRVQDQTNGGVYWESTVAAPIVAGETIWLGFYYFAATGTISFSTSTAENALPFHEPSAGWTPLGTAVTNGANRLSTSVNYGWTVGGPGLSPNSTVYAVRAYTVNGATVTPLFVDDVDHWGSWPYAASHDAGAGSVAWNWVGAPNLTLRNASIGGQTYAYHTTNAAKLFLDNRAALVILAAHLNDPGASQYSDLLDAAVAAIAPLCPDASYALVTESPSETYIEQPLAAVTYNSDHVRRVGRQVAQCVAYAKRKGWWVIDTYKAVAALAAPRTVDGIHPSPATSAVQAGVFLSAFEQP